MSLDLNAKTTALVLIDVQQGTLAMPLAPYDRTALTGKAAELGQAFARAEAPIIKVRIAFSADGGDRPRQPVDHPMTLPEGGIPDEWSAFAPEIEALPCVATISKQQWSAFFGTPLDLQLRRRGIGTIVLGGIATNFGVESTARDGWQLGYSVIIAEDACTSLGEDLHRIAVERTLPRVSRVRTTAEIAAALQAAAA